MTPRREICKCAIGVHCPRHGHVSHEGAQEFTSRLKRLLRRQCWELQVSVEQTSPQGLVVTMNGRHHAERYQLMVRKL
jgi:hypothetical protein